jgi:chemotaxis protein MotB
MVMEEDPPAGVPEWVVTFGDMMSLLLTFFIMLVSLSEIKQDERFQAMIESLREQFGHETSPLSAAPGKYRPRNAELAQLASMGRAMRLDILRGGQRVRAPTGDEPAIQQRRPGMRTSVGGWVTFASGSAELSDEARSQLQRLVGELQGTPQKIEIRGHTELQPRPDGDAYADNWELAYARSRAVLAFLVQQGIDPRRIRLAQAAQYEPWTLSLDVQAQRLNPRVEVYMLDETVRDWVGQSAEPPPFSSPAESPSTR